MVIKKCYIESFGCFKNQTFDFSDGINIIYGENEKGKSTIAAFIRFVLFGFSKKQERDRYFPLDVSF
ncbi:MAG: AAA family ATPase, partial [Clostridia bacterium]|nr:AAA family ATPase [Clostridia bacterium]